MIKILVSFVIILTLFSSLINADALNIDSLIQVQIDNGYLDCYVDSGSGEYDWQYGALYTVDKIIILPSDTLNYDNRLKCVKQDVEKEINRLLQSRISEGYLYHNYILKDILKNDSTVTILIGENKGPRPVISNIRFDGLKLTSETQLNRYITLDKAQFITQENLQHVESDVMEIPYIEYTPPPSVLLHPGYIEADIVLTARDKRLFNLEGSIGYLSDQDELLWMGDLTLQNLFGKGRRIDIFSQKVNTDNQNLSITYWQPSFLIGVGGIDVTVSTRDYRSQFYEFSTNLQALYKIRRSLKLGGKLSYKSVEPDTEDGSFTVYSAGFIAEYSNSSYMKVRDNQYRFNWEISYAARRSGNDSLLSSGIAYDDTRIHLGISYKLPLFLKTSYYQKIQYFGFETNDDLPPLSELYLLGGEQTIRGFRDEQFAAIRTVLASTEYHIHFNSGFMFTFIDAAYLYNRIEENNSVNDDEYYRFGYGIGVLLESKGREIQISFGWNKDLPFDQPRLSIQFQTGL